MFTECWITARNFCAVGHYWRLFGIAELLSSAMNCSTGGSTRESSYFFFAHRIFHVIEANYDLVWLLELHGSGVAAARNTSATRKAQRTLCKVGSWSSSQPRERNAAPAHQERPGKNQVTAFFIIAINSLIFSFCALSHVYPRSLYSD